jgi:hypothetical protein
MPEHHLSYTFAHLLFIWVKNHSYIKVYWADNITTWLSVVGAGWSSWCRPGRDSLKPKFPPINLLCTLYPSFSVHQNLLLGAELASIYPTSKVFSE